MQLIALVSEAASSQSAESGGLNFDAIQTASCTAQDPQDGLTEAHSFYYSVRDLYVVEPKDFGYQVTIEAFSH